MNLNKLSRESFDSPVDHSKRKTMKFIGLGIAGLIGGVGYDTLMNTRAEAKKFSYPTPEQKKVISNLIIESESNPEVFKGIRLVINKSQQKLSLYKDSLPDMPDGELVAEFPVSTGTVIDGTDYRNRDFISKIQYVEKDPNINKLIKGYWIPVKEYAKFIVGIHGIPKEVEKDIGKPASHGCIRMILSQLELIVPLLRSETQVHMRD
jgi:L,D-transpeptidase catalytic domain